MPTATDTPAKLSVTASSKRFSQSESPPPVASAKIRPGITKEENPNPKIEAAKASHLICSRSSPPERRKRNTKLTAEARMHMGSSRVTPCVRSAIQGYSSRPNGLRTPPRSGSRPGVRRIERLSETITTPENQARGRHLLEESLPSGNSRG